MAKDDKPPQLFSEVIALADRGQIDRILSRVYADVIEQVTSKAALHDIEWKGEIGVKLKVAAEPDGKIAIGFSRTVKVDEEKMPKARFYYDPDTRETVLDAPKQVKIPGFDKHGNPEQKQAKSAAAPRAAGKEEG